MDQTQGIEVHIPGEGGTRAVTAYAVLPPGARRGAVVLHEIYGRQPEIDRVVERFGARGYAAVAPDLFAAGSRPLCIRQAIKAIASGQGPQIDLVRAARRWLCDQAGLSEGNVGLTGFCLGGGLALAAGCGWGAVSTNYGAVPPAEVLRGSGPVIGCYGGRDRLFGDQGEVLRKRLQALSVPVEVYRFETVGHSFLTDGHHPIAAALSWPLFHVRYDPQVAAQAWDRIFAYFDRWLPVSSSGSACDPAGSGGHAVAAR